MHKSKIKKGDTVIVTAGDDKGQKGVVLAVLKPNNPFKGDFRVLVEGINLVKRHTKANPAQEKSGGIIEKEAAIAISNVAILNQATGKADKIGFKKLENGKKVRVFKSTQEMIDSE